MITSPTSAVIFAGEKNSLLGPPTMMRCSRGLSEVLLGEGALVDVPVVKEVTNPEDVASVSEAEGAVAAEDVATGGCIFAEVATEGGEVCAGEDDAPLEACPLPIPIAFAWNAANLSPGFIAKTIPC